MTEASNSSSNQALSYEQAIEQAIRLRKQGLTYPAIADHLKRAGYRSPYTRNPVGHLAVRQMVTKAQSDIAAAVKEPKPAPFEGNEEPTKPILPAVNEKMTPQASLKEQRTEVRSPLFDALQAIRELSASPSLNSATKLRLIEHLAKTASSY